MNKSLPYILLALILLLMAVTQFFLSNNENEIHVENKPQEKINESQVQEKVESFSTVIDHIFIGQKDDSGSRKIVAFERELPTHEQKYALHSGDVYIFVQFTSGLSENQERDYLSQIKIEGEEGLVVQIGKNYNQHQIDITNILEKVKITLGDLSPITIQRKEPLNIALVNSNSEKNRFFLKGQFNSPVLLVPSIGENPIFSFNERMDITQKFYGVNNHREIGEWLDDKRYELKLENISEETVINFENLYSLDGNYLTQWQQFISIKKVKERIWKDLTTYKSQVGWGERLRYYDRLLFSPNKERFIGIIDIGMIEGDANGTNYSFILEEENKKPIMVEEYFYTDFNILGFPLQWIDDESFIYGNGSKVFIYDVLTGKKQILYEVNHGDFGSIHQVNYNPYEEEIYLYLLYYYYDQSEKKEMMYIDKLIYQMGEATPIIENRFSEMIVDSGFFKVLPIHSKQTGVYWTVITDGKIHTVFEGKDQSKKNFEGEVILANDKGVVFKAMEQNQDTSLLEYYWVDERFQITKITNPNSFVRPFGNDLVYVDEIENKLYRYDFDNHTWTLVEIDSTRIQLPIQERNAYYYYN